MIAAEQINNKTSLMEWKQKLSDSWVLPEILFGAEKYSGIIMGLKSDDLCVGLTYGVAEKGTDIFILQYFFIEKEYRNLKNVLFLLESILTKIKLGKGIKEIIWRYSLPNKAKDIHPDLVKKIPFCTTSEKTKVMTFGIKTKDFSYLRSFKWYKPLLWQEKGCKIIPWGQYSTKWKEYISKRELAGSGDPDYISPFMTDGDSVYDIKTSFALTDAETEEPLGWILCEQLSENEVKIRKFYIYSDKRKLGLGPTFSTYVLDVIESLYEYVYFNVIPGNRQMQMFTSIYCTPILYLNCIDYNLKIKFKEEVL